MSGQVEILPEYRIIHTDKKLTRYPPMMRFNKKSKHLNWIDGSYDLPGHETEGESWSKEKTLKMYRVSRLPHGRLTGDASRPSDGHERPCAVEHSRALKNVYTRPVACKSWVGHSVHCGGVVGKLQTWTTWFILNRYYDVKRHTAFCLHISYSSLWGVARFCSPAISKPSIR